MNKAHDLHIYDTLAAEKKPFETIEPGKVRLYACGMTVYDRCHIGHGRIFVVFDMLVRYLRYLDFEVDYVRNITDIDDKIIARAAQNQESIENLTARCITEMHADEAALLSQPPSQEPKATAHIAAIIALIERLVAAGAAYHVDQGDVYFKVSSYADYGRLSRQDVGALRVGARVDVVSAKRDPLDFVLWKQAKPGEPSWASPWGEGRPGWHIECSAMAGHCLGERIDIHGGGLDLRFPHHQNEVAQTEMTTGKTFVNYWMHVGHVRVDHQKMSKSLGNFSTIAEVLKQYPGEVVRYFMLMSHYRSPINYTQSNLDHAHQGLSRLYRVLRDGEALLAEHAPTARVVESEAKFEAAMNDDLNTPEAIAVLFELANQFYRAQAQDPLRAARLCLTLQHLAEVLGLLTQDPKVLLQGVDEQDVGRIEALIADRKAAREAKDWARADQIRDTLLAMGIELEDSSGGTVWRRVSTP